MPGYVEDTIVALATAPGLAAIAVIRLSGHAAVEIAARVLPPAATPFESHRVSLAVLHEPGSTDAIDQVLVLPMLAPRSFTGEDVVELHCHGSPLIADRVLRALLAAGARQARPGEFTERAFLNGKIDLCQAEAIGDLIEASSEAGRSAAWQHLQGGLSRRVLELRELLLDVRALVEAHLDFPEDDLPPTAEHEISSGIASSEDAVTRLAATFARGRLAREGLRVALVGKPNVGKSSLLNAFLGRDRALVSAQAGTTRDYIEEPVELGALRILLCDTAGVRATADSIEQAGVERTRRMMAAADVVVVVLDAALALDGEDEIVLAAARERPHVVVRNKVDLPTAWSPDRQMIDVSAQAGLGLDALGRAIRDALPPQGGLELEPANEPVLVTRVRHHAALLATSGALRRAQLALELGQGLEIVSSELQAAVLELERLVGASDVEDLLDRIFSRFCVGK